MCSRVRCNTDYDVGPCLDHTNSNDDIVVRGEEGKGGVWGRGGGGVHFCFRFVFWWGGECCCCICAGKRVVGAARGRVSIHSQSGFSCCKFRFKKQFASRRAIKIVIKMVSYGTVVAMVVLSPPPHPLFWSMLCSTGDGKAVFRL